MTVTTSILASYLPIARTDGVLVLEMRPQRVRRPVDLPALGAGPRVRRAHAQQVLRPPAACGTRYG